MIYENKQMTKETLEKQLQEAVSQLLQMARDLSWNKIPDACRYIISEIDSSKDNLLTKIKRRKALNDRKNPESLAAFMPQLLTLYPDVYDFNLYIYQTLKDLAIIEIGYFSRSSLDPEYRKKVQRHPPMLHAKLSMPPYYSDKIKFNINWEHYPLRLRWKMYWVTKGKKIH